MKKSYSLLTIGLCLGVCLSQAQYIKLLNCDGGGSWMPNSVTLSGNVLYGIIPYGGTNYWGSVFKINTDGTGYTQLYELNGTTEGNRPHGSLILSGDELYGTTLAGGSNDMGCIFKIHTDGSGYTNLHDFSGTADGCYPSGSLLLSDNMLYGMTLEGGSNDKGCIYKISIINNAFTNFYNFSGTTDGEQPNGSLTLSENILYGLASYGGSNGKGCLFKVNTDGTGFTPLLTFDETTNGSYPMGSLTMSGDLFYGTTTSGGANNFGTVFKINRNGSGYTKLLDFNGTGNGRYPVGSVMLIGTVLYGMTHSGGANSLGCIYKINTDGTEYTKLLDFNGTENGSEPESDFTFSGYALFGMTTTGGTNNDGTVFKYILSPDDQTSNITFPFIGINVADISWVSGNGEKRAVFVKEGTGTATYPENNTSYIASENWNSKGTPLGTSGYYCVYNDIGNLVPLTGLTPGTTYTVQVFEYNGEAGNEQYQTSTEAGNPNVFQTDEVNAIQTDRENLVQIYSAGSNIYAKISQSDRKAELKVYNLSGVCIATSNTLEEGQNKITVDYSPGIYIVKLVLDNEQYIQKVIIK